MTGYALSIFPDHADQLAASAITPEVARERGYVSIDSRKQLQRYAKGFGSKCPIPGLLIPLRRLDGSVWGYQYRPTAPRVMDGKPRKYETPFQQPGGIDIPPGIKDKIGDPSVPLLVTEGSKKADSAVSARACVRVGARRVELARHQPGWRQGRAAGMARHGAERPPGHPGVRLRPVP